MVSLSLQGVFRSLRLHYGPDAPRAAMDALYRQFIEPGDLVFDIGAYVGQGVASFRRVGARVVAVEPQTLPIDALTHIYGRDLLVFIVPRALGAETAKGVLHVNGANPIASTMSDVFLERARSTEGWEEQTWEEDIDVEVVTLDALIARFGVPTFVKLDVSGSEDAVLRGLSHPLQALSFKFTTIMRDIAVACLERLLLLGDYHYNIELRDVSTLKLDQWVSAAEIADHLFSLPHAANSGYIYAALVSHN